MMKRLLTLIFPVLLLLGGCAKPDAAAERWYVALDSLKQQENYTVEEVTVTPEETLYRIRRYDLIRAQTQDPEETLYFSREEGTCYGLGWVEDPGIWAKKEIETSDLYFYDYLLLDRLNQISGLIDMGLLTYQEETGIYAGSSLDCRYVYRDLEHTPLTLQIYLKNGQIAGIYEKWMCTKDGVDLGIYEDTMKITDIATTMVRLPGDVILVEEE